MSTFGYPWPGGGHESLWRVCTDIRNHAAHGEDQSITLSKVENYYKPLLKLLNVIQKQCEVDKD